MSWYDWARADKALLAFTRQMIRFRQDHPVFCRRRWFQGRAIHGAAISDIGWFTPAGAEMSEQDWQAGFAKSLAVFLNGKTIPTVGERGEQVIDDSFFIMFNAHQEPIEFALPDAQWGDGWTVALDTAVAAEEPAGAPAASPPVHAAGARLTVQAWSVVVLQQAG
jgi:glycogen operon protein